MLHGRPSIYLIQDRLLDQWSHLSHSRSCFSLWHLCSLDDGDHTNVDIFPPFGSVFRFRPCWMQGIFWCLSLEYTSLHFKSRDINYALWLDKGKRFPSRRAEKFGQTNFSVLRCGKVWRKTQERRWASSVFSLKLGGRRDGKNCRNGRRNGKNVGLYIGLYIS